jgi:hypothetical protein
MKRLESGCIAIQHLLENEQIACLIVLKLLILCIEMKMET